MSLLGSLLKNRRAGETKLAWNLPALAGPADPEPIKGHGPHRYVFQLFALSTPITATETGAALEDAKPRDVIAAAHGPALARGRLDGLYTR